MEDLPETRVPIDTPLPPRYNLRARLRPQRDPIIPNMGPMLPPPLIPNVQPVPMSFNDPPPRYGPSIDLSTIDFVEIPYQDLVERTRPVLPLEQMLERTARRRAEERRREGRPQRQIPTRTGRQRRHSDVEVREGEVSGAARRRRRLNAELNYESEGEGNREGNERRRNGRGRR